MSTAMLRGRVVRGGLIVAMFCGGALALRVLCGRNGTEKHQLSIRSELALRRMATTIQMKVSASGEAPPSRDDAGSILDWASDSLLQHDLEEHDGRCYVDSFRNCIYAIEPRRHWLCLCSPGPNGRQEGGEGDDICVEFELRGDRIESRRGT